MANKKLIEVALPLEKINEASAREKSIRHGHPSTLHLWWARRPLAAARAVIWASLVDDPSSHPELFPTEESQNIERQRLFKILEDLVVWENSNNQQVLDAAKTEILRSTNGNPPALLDPFAGGGAIPLEAQRLGLEAHAHDLNPVAVTINKAMIEIPSVFSDFHSVNPESNSDLRKVISDENASGLMQDVEYYANLLKKKAYAKLKPLYPSVKLPSNYGDGEATVIAWIWSRTVKCPNPACNCRVPLMKSLDLSKKRGHEVSVKFDINEDNEDIDIRIVNHKGSGEGTVNRKGAICPKCNTPIGFPYIRSQATQGLMKPKLIAVVAEGKKGRIYLPATSDQINASKVDKPTSFPDAVLPDNPRNFNTPIYGLNHFSDHFTNRQLTTLVTFSSLIQDVKKEVVSDAISCGISNDSIPLRKGGKGALAYAEAICVYLSFLVSKLADRGSSVCSWDSSRDGLRNTFGRQAIPMVWDYAESNPFSHSSGCFDNMLTWISECIERLPSKPVSYADQMNAQIDCGLRNIMISTDPPYYDNINYADLSDFFYIWLRESLKDIYPELYSTLLTPKAEELVASSYRFDGNVSKAKDFFEDGMLSACKQIYMYSRDDIPVTIYYAYKQSEQEVDNNTTLNSSTGWETMLSAIINAGFSITGTWPMRTEMANRNVASGSNALASSIVLVCRKRGNESLPITRRNLIGVLRKELKSALKKLQSSNIAPVDLAQSAIGPGMAVFSRYSKVLEADGSKMSVRSALQVINEELDLYFNEQVGDLDSMSRFCVDLYTQSAFNDIQFGQADVLARAKGTSVDAIASHGPVYAKGGKVHLIDRDQLPDKIDHNENCIWMFAQQLTHLMATGGVDACAKAIFDMMGSNAEKAKDLAYRLYTIAEQKKWANEAYAYNALVVAWPDIQARAAELKAERPEQMNIFDF